MPLSRVLEPEVMSGADEAADYDEMDFSATDRLFAERAAALAPPGTWIVDLGCGNAKIPLGIAALVPNPICAMEMSAEMLAVAARNRTAAAIPSARFTLVRGDAKRLPIRSAGLVISNSLIHHIPDPLDAFREIARISFAPSGRHFPEHSAERPSILIRDLVRPESESALTALVDAHAANWSGLQRRLFEDSLRAALSLEEVRALIADAGLTGVHVTQITDRHWSAERSR